MARFVHAPLLAALVIGCSDDPADESITPPPSPCAPLEIAQLDGSCVRPGVPLDGCAPGFEHDGEYGCNAILPSESCQPGFMAVPGDQACRPVMSCGSGKWGDLPVDASTVYVDTNYAGTDGNGTANRPWPTITAAYVAASANALIAIAKGVYQENVVIWDKPVRLWGVCPDDVEIVAAGPGVGGCPPGAVCIGPGADGTEVGGVSVRGDGLGFTVSGSRDVLLDRVWVRQSTVRGMDIEGVVGPTAVRVTGSLVEQSVAAGIHVSNAEATIEATLVRSSVPELPDKKMGRGINIQVACSPSTLTCDTSTRASAVVRGSVVEQNHESGVFVMGSDATIEATVVRGTQPRASDQKAGRGIAIQVPCIQGQCDPAGRSNVTVRASIVEQNHNAGIYISGSDALVETTVVRSTQPEAFDQRFGRGINIQTPCNEQGLCLSMAGANATVRASLIKESYDRAILIADSEATIEATVVQKTLARPFDNLVGDGIAVHAESATARASLAGVRIQDSVRAGLSSFGAFVSLGATRIECAAFDIDSENYLGHDFILEDRGANVCGCGSEGACKSVSVGLVAPDATDVE